MTINKLDEYDKFPPSGCLSSYVEMHIKYHDGPLYLVPKKPGVWNVGNNNSDKPVSDNSVHIRGDK